MRNWLKGFITVGLVYAVGKIAGYGECLEQVARDYGKDIPNETLMVKVYKHVSVVAKNDHVE